MAVTRSLLCGRDGLGELLLAHRRASRNVELSRALLEILLREVAQPRVPAAPSAATGSRRAGGPMPVAAAALHLLGAQPQRLEQIGRLRLGRLGRTMHLVARELRLDEPQQRVG